ncbi:hypothetical protein D3C74_171350 [compost metagenome]
MLKCSYFILDERKQMVCRSKAALSHEFELYELFDRTKDAFLHELPDGSTQCDFT